LAPTDIARASSTPCRPGPAGTTWCGSWKGIEGEVAVHADLRVHFLEQLDANATARTRRRLHRWRALREEIREDLLTRASNPRVGAFTRACGSDALGANVLPIPHTGFLPADTPRMLSTVSAIERGLTWEGFVLRYNTATGADGPPGDAAPSAPPLGESWVLRLGSNYLYNR